MYRKLSYKTLIGMDGAFVRVHDLEYDAFDQICQVKVKHKWQKIPKSWKFLQIIIGINLVSEDEEFEVYSLKERNDIQCPAV